MIRKSRVEPRGVNIWWQNSSNRASSFGFFWEVLGFFVQKFDWNRTPLSLLNPHPSSDHFKSFPPKNKKIPTRRYPTLHKKDKKSLSHEHKKFIPRKRFFKHSVEHFSEMKSVALLLIFLPAFLHVSAALSCYNCTYSDLSYCSVSGKTSCKYAESSDRMKCLDSKQCFEAKLHVVYMKGEAEIRCKCFIRKRFNFLSLFSSGHSWMLSTMAWETIQRTGLWSANVRRVALQQAVFVRR